MPGSQLARRPAGTVDLTFDEMMRRAEIYARSHLVPAALRGKPADVVLVGQLGQALGVPFVAALSEIYVIEGRPSPSAQLRLALIRRAGHEARFTTSTPERAVIRGRRAENRGDPDAWVEVEWTIGMARQAGLTNKDVWKKYPDAMLRARAASALCRMEFSDVLTALALDPYSPEEHGLGAGGDEDYDDPYDDGDVVDADIVPAPAAPGPWSEPDTDDPDPDPEDEEWPADLPPEGTTTPDPPAEEPWSGERWRDELRSRNRKVVAAIRHAQAAARQLELPVPGTLDDLHPQIHAALVHWLEEDTTT